MSETKGQHQAGSECPQCAELQAKLERIREIVTGNGDARRGRKPAEFATAYGKVIAAAASARGMKLSQVSTQIGYAGDYVARVCRGDLPLSRRAALLIGQALGVELVSYLEEIAPAPPPAPAANPQLPGIPGQEA